MRAKRKKYSQKMPCTAQPRPLDLQLTKRPNPTKTWTNGATQAIVSQDQFVYFEKKTEVVR